MSSDVSKYSVIGLMSGTSLDGLDIACCQFSLKKGRQGKQPSGCLSQLVRQPSGLLSEPVWKYKILSAKTYPYAKKWKEKLSTIEKKSAVELAKLHSEYGHFLGKKVNDFIGEFRLSPGRGAFISSHGHTIFHQPEKKFTFQLGSGASIAAESGLPVICDFRTSDVALGGQGAPLVPIGDKLLFSDYGYCLNIGGIANVSYEQREVHGSKEGSRRIAYDICPANIVLNYLAGKLGKEYDKNGDTAKSGKVSEELLKDLNALNYYFLKPPKSLGKEWILKFIFPILAQHRISVEDKMRTMVEHIAIQIANSIRSSVITGNLSLLITGGGYHNKFLMERIMVYSSAQGSLKSPLDIYCPDKLTIDFKEALIFAFLGVLRLRDEVNCLSSVTGAERDNCGGTVYLP